MDVAIVGSGVTGLVAAHLLAPHHRVTLYEAADRLGGHANTVTVTDPDAGELGIDTGFIVHNDRNYPNLVRLFEELDVPTQDSEMSFGVVDRASGFAYRATNLDTLLADRANWRNPALYRMLGDLVRFWRHSRSFLASGDDTTTVGEFLADGGYGEAFVELHFRPMGAAVWSTDPARFGEFPARTLFTFLAHHGLLGVGNRPQWRTVVGGSRTYVDAVAARLDERGAEIRLGDPVLEVRRTPDGSVSVRSKHTDAVFDRVVLATHSDQSRAMLSDASSAEAGLLEAVRYQPNEAVLHTDTSILPPQRKAWAAWNYDRRSPDPGAATLTYDLTLLQRLGGRERYLVTLNETDHLDPGRILHRQTYHHPLFDRAAVAAQRRLADVDGAFGVHFCGAWAGYGFHEDGAKAARTVAERLGVVWT